MLLESLSFFDRWVMITGSYCHCDGRGDDDDANGVRVDDDDGHDPSVCSCRDCRFAQMSWRWRMALKKIRQTVDPRSMWPRSMSQPRITFSS